MVLIRCLPLLALAASALAQAQVSAAPLEPAAWLAGCWKADGKDKGSGEHWLQPVGQLMLGVGQTVKGGHVVSFEFMQIRQGESGRLQFVALVGGKRETVFQAIRQEPGHLVFENPEHDFPQRVIYQQQPQGRLLARIEGTRGGVLRAVDFPMQREPCDP